MDPDVTIEMVFVAITEGDITTARERMEDVEEWIAKGGYVPANYAHAVERMESLELEASELVTALDSDPWAV